jgi:NADH dehydrogenase
MTAATKQVCILGGGFAGLYTALRLDELPWQSAVKPKITLIDKSDRFFLGNIKVNITNSEIRTVVNV